MTSLRKVEKMILIRVISVLQICQILGGKALVLYMLVRTMHRVVIGKNSNNESYVDT